MKNFRIVIIMMGILSFSSCADFFETDSPSTLGKEDVFSNLTRTEQAIAGIYDQFGQDRSYRNRLSCGYQGLNTDIEYNNKGSDTEYYTYNYQLTGNLSRDGGKDPWGYLNTAIERANDVIEGIREYGDTTNTEYAYFLGEALFLRSFVYLEMVKFWGDLPPRFESLSKNPDGVNIAKNDRNIIYEQLRTDLKQAAQLMPWSASCPGYATNYVGRPSKAAALALLARMDLMYAGYALRPDYIDPSGNAPYGVQLNVKDDALRQELYAEAMDACAQIINQEDNKFQDTFAEVFKDICSEVTDYSQTEYIWVIDFVANGRGQFLNYNTSSVSDANLDGVLKHYVSGSTNAAQSIVPTFVYAFEDGDLRKDVTVLPYRWYNDDASDNYSNDSTRLTVFPGSENGVERLWQRHQNVASYYLGKYRIEWMSRDYNSGANDDGIDYPIIRYGDVLLMYAEASLGPITTDINTGAVSTSGNITSATPCNLTPQAAFDKVRARAGLTSKTLNIENIINERAFELCGEYIRKYDLMRWGLLKHNLVKAMADIAALNAHEGTYAQTSDSIWFKYRLSDTPDDYRHTGATQNVYLMDSIWGLNIGENSRPEWFNSDNGWVAKNIFYSSSDDIRHLNSSDYYLYYSEDLLDSRHYWPIYRINVGASNGTLWNDYGYGQ